MTCNLNVKSLKLITIIFITSFLKNDPKKYKNGQPAKFRYSLAEHCTRACTNRR